MHARQFGHEHVLVLDPGEHALEKITSYLTQRRIFAGRLSAIGGFRQVELKYYNTQTLQYEQQEMKKQVEVVNLTGNIALLDGKPFIHAHVTVSDWEYRSYSGHLGEGIVDPTLEVFLTQFDGVITRWQNEQTGLDELRMEEVGTPI